MSVIKTFDTKQARILIVDDNAKNIKVLGTILREKKFLVSVAMNGKEALNILKKEMPDLILLDIFMPEMDGFEVCKKIKENDEIKDIPIIFLTALTSHKDKVKGFEVGAVDYITKPFNELELEARINTHLNLVFAYRELKYNNNILAKINDEIKRKNLQLKYTMSELEVLAKTDSLTNTYNRRFMYEKLKEYKKQKKDFSIIMGDIDFFKDFNDIYGHLCGDYILKNLSETLKEQLREEDIISRWGGEEFLILLPKTNLVTAGKIAENLRKNIKNKIFIFGDNKLKLTLTFGVTEYRNDLDIDTVIKNVDEALYKGKRKGKNCVITF